jgi:hypothetical protein
MGRWRYLNLAIVLAVLVFLYIGIFTSSSPLAPKALGTVVHPWQPVEAWRVRAGHGRGLTPGRKTGVQVQFCPGCYRDIRRAGAAIAVERPDGLAAPNVARVRGAPHRLAAHVGVPDRACADAPRLWVGAADWSGVVHWASWPIPDRAVAADACESDGSGQSGGEGR